MRNYFSVEDALFFFKLFRWDEAAQENFSESCLRIKVREGVSIRGSELLWLFVICTWFRDSIFQVGG